MVVTCSRNDDRMQGGPCLSGACGLECDRHLTVIAVVMMMVVKYKHPLLMSPQQTHAVIFFLIHWFVSVKSPRGPGYCITFLQCMVYICCPPPLFFFNRGWRHGFIYFVHVCMCMLSMDAEEKVYELIRERESVFVREKESVWGFFR